MRKKKHPFPGNISLCKTKIPFEEGKGQTKNITLCTKKKKIIPHTENSFFWNFFFENPFNVKKKLLCRISWLKKETWSAKKNPCVNRTVFVKSWNSLCEKEGFPYFNGAQVWHILWEGRVGGSGTAARSYNILQGEGEGGLLLHYTASLDCYTVTLLHCYTSQPPNWMVRGHWPQHTGYYQSKAVCPTLQ